MKYSGHLVKVAFQSMLEILKQTIISNYTVKDVVWGIDHPLVKLGNDILPKVSESLISKYGNNLKYESSITYCLYNINNYIY